MNAVLLALPLLHALTAPPCPRALPDPVRGATLVHLDDAADGDPANDGKRGYGTAHAKRALAALKDMRLNTVSLMVVARLSHRQDTAVRPDWDVRGRLDRAALKSMVADAHQAGLAVVLVPHLQLDDGSWRGELDPADPDAFMGSWGAFMDGMASMARETCTEALSVGLEFKSLTARADMEPRFRALVSRVRATFKGATTYSANWDELERVPFLDALDVAGVNAFWPLQEREGASDMATLQRGAARVVSVVDAVHRARGRRVLLMEFGFKARRDGALRPWEWPGEPSAAGPTDPALQARAYRALLCAVVGRPAFRGAMAWYIPSDLDDVEHPARWEGEDGFSPVGKPAADELRSFCGAAATSTR